MSNSEYFEVDQLGIDKLKNDCFNNAREFSYFRKGEWTGFEASLLNALNWAQAHPAIEMSAMATTATALEMFARAVTATAPIIANALAALAVKESIEWIRDRYVLSRPRPNHICRRVICSTMISRDQIKRWENVCGEGGVATMPRSQRGPFTFVVSDRMWAVFSRFGPNDLRGLKGTDKQMGLMLKDQFDREFYQLRLASYQKGIARTQRRAKI